MKKNKKTYLLLALVLVVWGILGFKIVASINPSSDEMTPKKELVKFVPKQLKERDTFSIVANYRDPFLGTLPKNKRAKKDKGAISRKETLPEKNISYSGFVTENGSGNKIFFLVIDGQQQMMSVNQKTMDVKVVSGDSEKVKVRYNGKIKTIPLAQ